MIAYILFIAPWPAIRSLNDVYRRTLQSLNLHAVPCRYPVYCRLLLREFCVASSSKFYLLLEPGNYEQYLRLKMR